jgi:hypothetical protein
MNANPLEGSEPLADLEACFLAEMQARRERLAHWLRLIEMEVRRQDKAGAGRHRRCRAAGTTRRSRTA